MTNTSIPSHASVVIIGGGQAGLAMSYHLKQSGIDHVILEKHQIAHSWKTKRWDAFCLVTPNWQCRLPGYPYQGSDPRASCCATRSSPISRITPGTSPHRSRKALPSPA